MGTCYVLFGSNMGDKEKLFDEACLLISNRCGAIVGVSSSYESEPWGFDADEWFLNRLIVVDTELDPETVLHELMEIEAELGRERHPEVSGYTSRTADLDILYFGQQVLVTPTLTLPHPRLHLRRFALLPLCEVVPELVHPVFQVTQRELLSRCPDQSIVRVME